MEGVRKTWLDTILKWRLNPTAPGSEQHWCPELDTAPRDKLKEIQSEKLEVLARYLWECNAFYAALEIRPSVDLKPYGTLPKTEFKAKPVVDLRQAPR